MRQGFPTGFPFQGNSCCIWVTTLWEHFCVTASWSMCEISPMAWWNIIGGCSSAGRSAKQKWIFLHPKKWHTVRYGSPSCIQPLTHPAGAQSFPIAQSLGICGFGLWEVESDLSTKVVETFCTPELPSWGNYAPKWRMFISWCGNHQLRPVNCPIGRVLEFLQERFSGGLSPSTLKV